ncbi:hypothetical protein D3C78_1370740 [compost metagenome]
MEVQQGQPQLFAALHFIKKGFAGFFQRLGHRVAKVNQIAVVRQDLPWAVAVLRTGAFKLIDHVGRQRGGLPLTLIFSEQGECGRLQFVRADNRLIHAA